MRGCFDIVRVVVLMAHACIIRWLRQLSPRSEGAAYSMRADRVRQIVRKTYMFFSRIGWGLFLLWPQACDVEHCATCPGDATTCATCKVGYVLNGNTCEARRFLCNYIWHKTNHALRGST